MRIFTMMCILCSAISIFPHNEENTSLGSSITERLYTFANNPATHWSMYVTSGIIPQIGFKALPASRVLQTGTAPLINNSLHRWLGYNTHLTQVAFTLSQKFGTHLVNVGSAINDTTHVFTNKDDYPNRNSQCAFFMGSLYGAYLEHYIEPHVHNVIYNWLAENCDNSSVRYWTARILPTCITWLCHHGFALMFPNNVTAAFSKGASVGIDLVDTYKEIRNIYRAYQHVQQLNSYNYHDST